MRSQPKSYKKLNIRHENIKKVIDLIKNSPQKLSRADIARKLSLSTPSVSSIIGVLIKNNIIIETDDENQVSTVGRKPILLKLNRNCGYLIGILIEEKKCTLALADYTGNILNKEHYFYDKECKGNCTGYLITTINNLLEKEVKDPTKLLSICVSFPGVFDHQNQEVKFAPHSGIWQDEPIVKKLEKEFDCQVIMENNVNNALLAETWKGQIRSDNAVYLKLGDGIAAGILINGELYRGFNSLAGEVGFSVTDSVQLKDKVTDTGSFEQRFNSRKIFKELEKELGEQVEISKLITLLDNNKKLNQIIKKVNQNIVILLINIISLLNPQIIVIGGQYSQLLKNWIEDIEKQIKNNVPFSPKIVVSTLGDEVYYLGAIANSLHNIEKQLINKYFID